MMDKAWGAILKGTLLPVGDRVFGQRMVRRLRFLERAQWWDRSRIDALQLQLLRRTCTVAYRETPFYRDLFDQAGLKPEDLRSRGDLLRLPAVTKAMLREAYPERVTRATGQKTYETKTSGSTGKNFVVREDAFTAGWYRASFLLSLEWAGWRMGEAHVQTGMTHERSLDRRLKDALLRCHYVSAAMLDDESLDRTLDHMRRRGIRHLWGYPGSLYHLALRALTVGWDRPLSTVVTWGDNLYPHYREALEQAFRVRVTDTYGIGEGVQIAAQCGHGSTYHVHALDAVVEVVDDAGKPVTPGAAGHVLVTRLHPGPMPLIRYRIGDVVISGDGSPCPCGRGFETLGGVQGRDTDVVVTPDGNRLIVHFFTGILEHFDAVDEFQVVQEKEDGFRLLVVPAAGWEPGVAGAIRDALRAGGAHGMEITVETVDAIPFTQGGKRRFVISRLGERERSVRLEKRV